MADPTIREQLRELAERHVLYSRGGLAHGPDDPQWCVCDQPWPCDTRIVLDELDTLERRAIAATEALGETVKWIDDHEEALGHGYCDLNVGGGWAPEPANCTCGFDEKRDHWQAALEASRGSA